MTKCSMKPIKIYAENADPKALHQFYTAMEQDAAVQGAVMPDVHAGYSLPIGGVVATEGVIFPSWVGYDIGCGMCAQGFSFGRGAVEAYRQEIFEKIYEAVPIGLGKYHEGRKKLTWKNGPRPMPEHTEAVKEILAKKNGESQLGTLGSGNHFIEIGYDEDDMIWVIVHSGSRGVGHATATHYMKLAGGGKAREGHFGLRVDSTEGHAYQIDLNFCLEFALENRRQMLTTIYTVMKSFCDGEPTTELINRNHNHAESKDGRWIHRKGATHAEEGMAGVIPGNMRDGSFIVEGKGNPESLCSSSHGAGRVKSRSQAKKTIDFTTFKEEMEGITAKVEPSVIDESPGAYKDIFEVMRLQSGLVDVKHHVRPIINVKA